MKYEKPQLILKEYISLKPMASGLGEWLNDSGYDSDAADHISTYEINS